MLFFVNIIRPSKTMIQIPLKHIKIKGLWHKNTKNSQEPHRRRTAKCFFVYGQNKNGLLKYFLTFSTLDIKCFT